VHLRAGIFLIAYGTVVLGGDIYFLIYGPQATGTGVVSVLLTTLAGTLIFGGLAKLGVRPGNLFR
jgi:hypothetical protein